MQVLIYSVCASIKIQYLDACDHGVLNLYDGRISRIFYSVLGNDKFEYIRLLFLWFMYVLSTWLFFVTVVFRIIARTSYSLSLSAVIPRVVRLLSSVASSCCSPRVVAGRCLSRVSACRTADGVCDFLLLNVAGVVRVGVRGVSLCRSCLMQARKVTVPNTIALRRLHPATVTNVAIKILSTCLAFFLRCRFSWLSLSFLS
jgi:hypothetical protein